MNEPRYYRHPETGMCATFPMPGYEPVFDQPAVEPPVERKKPGPKPKAEAPKAE